MRTEYLWEFNILASVLNYTKAAEQLFISQSVLSRHIKRLEEEFDVPLFVRNTHSVELTEEGKYLHRYSERLMKVDDIASSVIAFSHPDANRTIRISCQEQTLCTPILTVLESFQEHYPEISMQFITNPAASSISHLGDADLLLSPCNFTDNLPPGVGFRHLTSQEALLAIPPYHHLGDLQELALSELRNEKMLVPFSEEMFGPYARNALLAFHKCHGNLSRIPTATPQEALLAVEFGKGVLIIPHHFKHRVYPHTRTLKITDSECEFPVYAYFHDQADNSSARLLISQLTLT